MLKIDGRDKRESWVERRRRFERLTARGNGGTAGKRGVKQKSA